MKVYVDRDICIGCRACEVHCPDIFKIDEHNISTVIFNGKVVGSVLKCARQAEEACPTGAIRVDKMGGFPEAALRGV